MEPGRAASVSQSYGTAVNRKWNKWRRWNVHMSSASQGFQYCEWFVLKLNEHEAESKWAQRCQRKHEFEYLDRLSIDAGEEQAAGAEDRAGYTVPLVIVSQSADADNVPTTCVILASPCRCLTLLLSLWVDVALWPILSLPPRLPNSVMWFGYRLAEALILLRHPCSVCDKWTHLLAFYGQFS